MNIAVVDDEEAIREQIYGFIKKRNSDFDISGFDTGEGLLAAGKEDGLQVYLAEQYRKNSAADKNGDVSFAELAAAKAVGKSDVSGISFKDMWQAV